MCEFYRHHPRAACDREDYVELVYDASRTRSCCVVFVDGVSDDDVVGGGGGWW